MGIRRRHPEARGDARTDWRRIVLGLVLLAVLPACDAGEDPPPSGISAAVGCPEEVRNGIVFGGCIEGVEIGDDSVTVVAKLGEPTRYCGLDFCDLPTFFYSDLDDPRRRDSLLVTFGTLDLVVSMYALNGYTGRTREGIGLGALRSDVLRKLGTPTQAQEQMLDVTDLYQFTDSVRFRIEYAPLENDSSVSAVDALIMEYSIPEPKRR